MTAAQTLTIELDIQTAAALKREAEERFMSVEQLATEAIKSHALMMEAPQKPWSAADLAAIHDGIDQLDRGEFYAQEEVEARIDALLRE